MTSSTQKHDPYFLSYINFRNIVILTIGAGLGISSAFLAGAASTTDVSVPNLTTLVSTQCKKDPVCIREVADGLERAAMTLMQVSRSLRAMLANMPTPYPLPPTPVPDPLPASPRPPDPLPPAPIDPLPPTPMPPPVLIDQPGTPPIPVSPGTSPGSVPSKPIPGTLPPVPVEPPISTIPNNGLECYFRMSENVPDDVFSDNLRAYRIENKGAMQLLASLNKCSQVKLSCIDSQITVTNLIGENVSIPFTIRSITKTDGFAKTYPVYGPTPNSYLGENMATCQSFIGSATTPGVPTPTPPATGGGGGRTTPVRSNLN